MKLQFLTAVAALASVGTAQAQNFGGDQVIDFNGIPIVNEGTLDLLSGVITPPAPSGSLTAVPGVVFDNTCLPYITACNTVWVSSIASGATRVDDGRLPSRTSPAPNVGTMDGYRITSFIIEYYTSEGDPTLGSGPGVRWTVSFWENYDRCSSLDPANATYAGPPTKAIPLVLPGSATAGTVTGHLVTVSLVGGLEFTMKADADGAYGGTQALDNMGFGVTTTAITAGAINYWVRAGNVVGPGTTCGVGDGTYYLNPGTASGTGLDDDNTYWLQSAPTTGTCFAGAAVATACTSTTNTNGIGPVYGGFYMEITADLTDCNNNGLPDFDDIAGGAADVNADGIPDSCQLAPPVAYCGQLFPTVTQGCTSVMTFAGTPSAAGTGVFTTTCSMLNTGVNAIQFYGISGQSSNPWSAQSNICVSQGVGVGLQRLPVSNTGGVNPCEGQVVTNMNAVMDTAGTLGYPHAAGNIINTQVWQRDPASAKTTQMSEALEFTLAP